MSMPRRLFGAKRRPISNVRAPTLQPMSLKKNILLKDIIALPDYKRNVKPLLIPNPMNEKQCVVINA